MDAISLLEKDHKTFKALFKRIASARAGSSVQRKAYAQLRDGLAMHDHIETSLFYPALQSHPQARGVVMEAYEEHHVMKGLLEDMDKLNVEDAVWQAKFKVMMENVQHHAKEEETGMFLKARKALKKKGLAELGTLMEALRSERMVRQ